MKSKFIKILVLTAVLVLSLICFIACKMPSDGNNKGDGTGKNASKGLEYEINADGKTCTITGIGSCTDTDLIIPETIDGYRVTKIGGSAFQNCMSLTSVVIASSITSIDYQAFYGCYRLVEVINKSKHINLKEDYDINVMTRFYALSISNCDDDYVSKLTNDNGYIVFSDDNYKILVGYNGTETDLVLPTYITDINHYAFYYCPSLTSIVIPDSVTSIGQCAFFGCTSLMSVVTGKSLSSIGSYAFNGCYTLIEVINKSSYMTVKKGAVGNGLIGYYALSVSNREDDYVSKLVKDDDYVIYIDGNDKILVGCIGLKKSLVLPTYVTEIYNGAFYDCSSLKSIEIPNSVTSIGEHAFKGCSSLTSITIPDSVTSIGEYAFYGCSSLKSIEIPNSVTSIGRRAFSNCENLKFREYNNGKYLGSNNNSYFALVEVINKNISTITIHDRTKIIIDWMFQGCKSLTSAIIGDSVTRVSEGAFSGCEALKSVVISDSVTTIADNAFNNCPSLTSIVIGDSVTSIGESAFSYCGLLMSVVIPESVTSIGESAFFWCDSLKIYCEAKSKPSGWSLDWNKSSCPVVWGYKG